MNSNFFALGGNSLLMMKLFYLYQTQNTKQMNITLLFKLATLREHIQLLNDRNNEVKEDEQEEEEWKSLNINKGFCSYAQERIWLDEQIRFDTKNDLAIYNIPNVFRVMSGTLSISRLRQSLLLVIEKHSILRTSLNYDRDEQCLRQHIEPTNNEIYSFQVSSIPSKDDFDEILLNEETNGKLFDLSMGRVFRCHLIRFCSCSSNDNDEESSRTAVDLLNDGDLIIFNFHHVAFDGSSTEIFLKDLKEAYLTNKLDTHLSLQYIDYSQYERKMSMDDARKYWQHLFDGYDEQEGQLQLPYDNKLLFSN
ncbi:unnamed protein product, partial [Didymodactylos carnosus]